MPNTEQNEPTEQPMDLATARRIEHEKMTRRAALRKLGFGAGMAAFALLGVDDFARMVGQRMERMAGDNKVALAVAREFQGAGIAFAGGPSWACHSCDDNCIPGAYQYCEPCVWPCTGSILRDENCGDFNYGKCQACCLARNPTPSGPHTGEVNTGYNYCVSFGSCT
jgi:GNAT superfamily N-acetyltransferase